VTATSFGYSSRRCLFGLCGALDEVRVGISKRLLNVGQAVLGKQPKAPFEAAVLAGVPLMVPGLLSARTAALPIGIDVMGCSP
jgi:hypothetical protein